MSVVIPYYNNARTLQRCLSSFTREQTVKPCELILVDDGSSEPAGPLIAGQDFGVPVRLLHCAHRGQSAATNVGLQAATGEVVLLSCADIVAVPNMVEVHAREYRIGPQGGAPLGVMGHIVYAPWLKMTPFLQFLSQDGPQFTFGAIVDPDVVHGQLLYSPNFSIVRQAILAVGGFDECFPYGFQDTDLGLRLSAMGVHWRYRKEAVALHDHPNDLTSFMRRNRSIGRNTLAMATRYPQLFDRPGLAQNILLIGQNPTLGADVRRACARFERIIMRGGGRLGKHQAPLFGLYSHGVGVGFVEGILQGDEGLASWFGIELATFRACRSALETAEAAEAAETRPAAASVPRRVGGRPSGQVAEGPALL